MPKKGNLIGLTKNGGNTKIPKKVKWHEKLPNVI